MTAAALIASLQQRGISLTVEGANIRCTATTAPITRADQALLKRHKAEIIALLQESQPDVVVTANPGGETTSEPRRCYACGTAQPADWDWRTTPCRVCRPKATSQGDCGAESTTFDAASMASGNIPSDSSADAWLEEAVQILVWLERCASRVSVAHVMQDLRELADDGGANAGRWRAVLAEAQRARRPSAHPANLCARCGAERLPLVSHHPCPACEGWMRPERVRGVALRLLREEVAQAPRLGNSAKDSPSLTTGCSDQVRRPAA